MTEENRENSWHLDKGVPIALIVAMLSGYAGGVWWMSDLNSRINYIERERERNSNLAGEIIQLRERLRSIERVSIRLEAWLDRRQGNETNQPSDQQEQP